MGCKTGAITIIALCLCICGLSIVRADEPAPSVNDAPVQYFDIFELRVLGNSRLSPSEIETWLYQYLGMHKSLEDVEKARKTLEELYHSHGYGTVFVDVPEQRIEADGVVRLAVSEAKLKQVHVSGARYFSNREIKAAIPEAKAGTTPSLTVLQQQVNDLNVQTNDRQVVPVLKAGSAPGTVDLNLKVDDHLPLHASLDVNDQYTTNTTPLRAAVGLSYDNLFNRLDSLAAQYQFSPQNRKEVNVWMGSYSTHVIDDVTRLVMVYVDSNSAVATLGAGDSKINVLGKGKTGSVRLIHPLAGSGNSLGSINLSVDYKNSLQNICANTTDRALCPFEKIPEKPADTSGSSSSTAPPDPHLDYSPINYVNFTLGYSGGWRGEKQQGTFSFSGSFGVRGLRNNSADFEDKRFLANSNYIVFRSDGLWIYRLPADFNMQFRYNAQYSFDPLIQNEQFSLTGMDGVRGYIESEALSDRGIKLTGQFGTPQWKWFNSKLAADAFIFYDYGTGQVLQPLQSEQTSHSPRGAGAGLNFSLSDHFNGMLIWERVLRDVASTKRGDSRVQFDVRTNW